MLPAFPSFLTAPSAAAGETILLVEDEPAVLRVTTRLLTQLGYRVLPAGHAHDALELARTHSGTIHLLLTDVLMPDMNGVELARAVQRVLPDIRVLFMSGYTADTLRDAKPDGRAALLVQKPFGRDAMSRAVRTALGPRTN